MLVLFDVKESVCIINKGLFIMYKERKYSVGMLIVCIFIGI